MPSLAWKCKMERREVATVGARELKEKDKSPGKKDSEPGERAASEVGTTRLMCDFPISSPS